MVSIKHFWCIIWSTPHTTLRGWFHYYHFSDENGEAYRGEVLQGTSQPEVLWFQVPDKAIIYFALMRECFLKVTVLRYILISLPTNQTGMHIQFKQWNRGWEANKKTSLKYSFWRGRSCHYNMACKQANTYKNTPFSKIITSKPLTFNLKQFNLNQIPVALI